MTTSYTFFVIAVVAFTALAAYWDFRWRKLPNALTVPVFLAGLIYGLAVGGFQSGLSGAGSGLLDALAGFATGFVVLLVLWLIGGAGGGDVKYMGALGAWLGASLTFKVLIVSTVFVAFAAVGVIAWHSCRLGISGVRERFLASADADPARSKRKRETPQQRRVRRRLMPFGVPVALATWVVLLVTALAR